VSQKKKKKKDRFAVSKKKIIMPQEPARNSKLVGLGLQYRSRIVI
jgi:hypothetical protein